MFIFLGIFILSFVAFFVHYLLVRPIGKEKVIELMLLYQLVFNIGFLGILSFIGLTFMPGVAADYIGWSPCHFQQELANVNLGYGVLGILSIWFRGLFWTAIVIGASIWLFGDGIHHFLDAFLDHNLNPGNLGILFYTDLLIPIILVVLLVLYHTQTINKNFTVY